MRPKQHAILTLAAALTGAVFLAAGCASSGSGGAAAGPVPSGAELDALAQKIARASFHDKGIVKVAQVLQDDATLQACNGADVAGKPLDEAAAKRIEAANLQTIRWPADGNYLGDWKKGEDIAQSGRGMTWTDSAQTPNGGNCYNCHQISKAEISYGTIGPSLYHYARLHGVTDPASPAAREMVKYTWGKIWNSKAYNACSNMPRAGHAGILTEAQIRDVMALLLDPSSPVNE
jgi:sulfur-oxidizing protein SoxX